MAKLVKALTAPRSTAASGWVYTYTSGTLTPATHLYTDNTLGSAHTNPKQLGTDGTLVAYCADNANFRIRIRNAADDTTLWDYDPGESSGGTTLADLTVGTGPANAFTAGSAETADDALEFIWENLSSQTTVAAEATIADLRAAHVTNGTLTADSKGQYLWEWWSKCWDVTWFGTTGDGVEDDTVEIQAAIDACATAGGGVVFFPGDEYKVSQLTIRNQDNVKLMGSGPGTILRSDAAGNSPLILIDGTSDGIEICSLQLQGKGGSGTSAEIAIQVASTVGDTAGEIPVNIHDVVFSGENDGEGFNVGVDCLGQRGHVNNCHFQRLYNSSAGYAVRTATGSKWTITNNSMVLVDAASARCGFGIGSSSGGDGTIASNNYIDGAGDAGILFSGTGQSAYGNYITGCQSSAIRAGGATNPTISGNSIVSSAANGLQVSGDTNGFAITGNACTSNGGHGIYIASTSNSNTAVPRNGVVSGNSCRSNTQSGINLTGTWKVSVLANTFTDNGSAGTYPAIDVSSRLNGGTHYGGDYNVIMNNAVMDTSGTEHSTPIRIQQSGGGGVSKVEQTVVVGNYFPPPTGGTTRYVWGVTGEMPNNWVANISGGFQRALHDYTSSTTLLAAQSGSICTNAGASGSITLTLPDLLSNGTTDGLEFTFLRVTAQNLVVTAGAGDTIVDSAEGTGDITLTTNVAVRIVSRSTNWYSLTDVP